MALTAAFLAAYAVAGFVAFRTINADLEKRVVQAVELTAESFEDRYELAGREALIAAVEARAATLDSEDEVLWLGTPDGRRLAGIALPAPASLVSGDVMGAVIAGDRDDRYRVAVRDLGKLRLIAALSYEEADEIGTGVLAAFGWVTGFIVVLSLVSAAILARRGQRRLDAIAATLRAVSLGTMSARVPVTGGGDDLDRLSSGINEAIEQLEGTVDGIRQVSTDIAHDLRTPINRLAILLERARDAAEGNPDMESRIDAASRQASGITATFDALLRIAQIEAGARKARFAPLSLPEIAAVLYDAYAPVAEEKGQRLVLGPAPKVAAPVHGDRDLLTQLFANLIENAIRHAPRGVTIRIDTGAGLQGVWMSVADNGPGIPEAERQKVLKRFYRLDKSRHTPGSGLGLALVRAIADLHGAVLGLDDNEPGLMARLTFPPSIGGA